MTGHAAHTAFAGADGWPFSGKNNSGSTCAHSADAHTSRAASAGTTPPPGSGITATDPNPRRRLVPAGAGALS